MPSPERESRGTRLIASGRKKLPSSPRSSCTDSSSCLKEPAFESGLGFGALYMLISSQQEFQRLNNLLEQTGALVQQMKGYLQHQERKLTSLSCSTCPNTNLTKMQTLSDQGSLNYNIEEESMQTYGHRSHVHDALHLEDWDLTAELVMAEVENNKMSALEVELQAELELLEFNLNITESCQEEAVVHDSFDGDCREVIDIMRNDRISHEMHDTSDSNKSRQSTHLGALSSSYAVSPLELDRRLHEVLEAQQKERILELEELLKETKTSLHAKEDEIVYWKKRVHDLTKTFQPSSETSRQSKRPNNFTIDGLSESYEFPLHTSGFSDSQSFDESVDLVKVVTESHTSWHIQEAGIDTTETADRRMGEIEVHTPLPIIHKSVRGHSVSRASESDYVQQDDSDSVTSPSCWDFCEQGNSSIANSNTSLHYRKDISSFCSTSSRDMPCIEHTNSARTEKLSTTMVNPSEPWKPIFKESKSKYQFVEEPLSSRKDSKFVTLEEINSLSAKESGNSGLSDSHLSTMKHLHLRIQSACHSAAKTPRESSQKKIEDLHIVTRGLRRSFNAEESSIGITSPVLGKIRHWEALGRGQTSDECAAYIMKTGNERQWME